MQWGYGSPHVPRRNGQIHRLSAVCGMNVKFRAYHGENCALQSQQFSHLAPGSYGFHSKQIDDSIASNREGHPSRLLRRVLSFRMREKRIYAYDLDKLSPTNSDRCLQ